MHATAPPSLILNIKHNTIARLSTLLQRGFLVPCSAPVSLADLLLSLPGFDREYITTHIETIFINGTAGDSLEQLIAPGNTVALSAAMPGLAGAIFRKGGIHAGLRSTPVSPPAVHTNGAFITVKLFNSIGADKGGHLLMSGVLVKGSALTRFFRNQRERLQSLLVDIRQSKKVLSLNEATLFAEAHSTLQLRVHSKITSHSE